MHAGPSPTLVGEVTVPNVASQSPLEQLLGPARLGPYLSAAGGDQAKALELYLWGTQLSGALHAQISFVEIAVRNALDGQLAVWNTAAGYGSDWSAAGRAAEPLYSLLRKQLDEARGRTSREARERPHGHPRHGAGTNHDDVVAQLMFGAWVKLVRPPSASESSNRQETLWHDGLHRAFPNATVNDADRVDLGDQLESLRRLRNRVAHHDNLLQVRLTARLNGMLSLLAKLDSGYPALAMGRSTLRQLIRADPRRAW